MKEYMKPTKDEYHDGIDCIKWTLSNIRFKLVGAKEAVNDLEIQEQAVLNSIEKIKTKWK